MSSSITIITIFACASYAITLIEIVHSLQCYECVGSESSDCAKGVNSSAVAVDCVPVVLRVQSRTYLRTGAEGALTTGSPGEFVPTPEQEPFIPYPACVSFSKLPHRSINGGQLVHRRCLVSAENFCRDYLQRHRFAKCQQCNHTDFCL